MGIRDFIQYLEEHQERLKRGPELSEAERGETLVEANSGMEALRRVMSEDFAVILLDVNMPEMDGFETASLIHDHPRFERPARDVQLASG